MVPPIDEGQRKDGSFKKLWLDTFVSGLTLSMF
nr:MAG TPA: hypothetical protein [Caudoviricetes sp.]